MAFALSFAAGAAFGCGYALLGIRSPAPPLVALAGLLGMVAGEAGWPWLWRLVLGWLDR